MWAFGHMLADLKVNQDAACQILTPSAIHRVEREFECVSPAVDGKGGPEEPAPAAV